MQLVGVRVFLAVSVIASASASSAVAQELAQAFHAGARAIPAPQFMRIYGNAQPPYGFVRFCNASPNECESNTTSDLRFQATPDRLSELDRVNRIINEQIRPATDMDIYGVNEHWTLPVNRGDCEDYALLKRKKLIKLGWPSNALLLTVVRDEKDEGHAVLTARTSQGDFVLDNKAEAVKLWNNTPYRYVMRQSYLDPHVWVSLDPSDQSTPQALAGFGANR